MVRRTHRFEPMSHLAVETARGLPPNPLRIASFGVTSPLLKQGPSVTDASKQCLGTAAPQGVSWRGQGTLQPRGSRGKGPIDGRPTPRRAFPSSVDPARCHQPTHCGTELPCVSIPLEGFEFWFVRTIRSSRAEVMISSLRQCNWPMV